jgi:enoyl-CoA hydratase/carnithine racemase
MGERVSIEISGGVADVRLVRSDKMNAVDDAMRAALIAAGDRLRHERGVRAVVLSGEGRAFCAGTDTGRFAGGARRTHTHAPRTRGMLNDSQYAVWVWRELPVPVIAAVHGVAFGAGFQLMLGADMRYLSPGTKLSIMETKWGLVPDMGGTQLFRHLAREDIVRELTYTGRVFSAEEALTYGFATRVTEDPHAAAMATAHEIAGRSPSAVRAAKRLLNAAPVCDVAAGLLAESLEQDLLIGKPDQVEAVRANVEKRLPVFED